LYQLQYVFSFYSSFNHLSISSFVNFFSFQTLLATEFDVGDGWLLSVPTIDYLTIKGVRLDGMGVIPDIETSSEEAPQVARKYLLDIVLPN